MLTTQSLARTNYLADMGQPQIPPAGLTSKLDSTAKDALSWNSEGRPTTPPEIRKYRQTSVCAPGKIVRHFGAADDTVPQGPFGAKSAASGGQNVVEALRTYPDSEIARWKLQQAEAVYASSKKEPLGHGLVRGHKIPEGMGTQQPFGCSYDARGKDLSRQAATVIFPTDLPSEEDPATREMYLRSHADYMPGEQRHRDYDWQKAGIDPAAHRFGAVDKAEYRDGVRKALQPDLDPTVQHGSKVLPKLHEDFKATATDFLGRPKLLGTGERQLPAGHTYGAPSLKRGQQPGGVGELLGGGYTLHEQQPDADLGKSLREGYRNSAKPGDEGRAFGVPSVRTDVALPKQRSVANANNYGNDPDAGSLLRPPLAAELGVGDDQFVQLRSADEVRQLAGESGMDLTDDEFKAIWAMAAEADGSAGAGTAGGDGGGRVCLDTFFRARHHLLAQTLVVPPPF